MPWWDEPRGSRYEPERDRSRREGPRYRAGPAGDERRSFGGDLRRRPEDAGAAGYAPHRGDRPGPPYGEPAGHDYSQESEGGFGGGGSGPNWGLEGDSERRRNFDFDDPGVGQSQAGYGQRAPAQYAARHPDHDFDPDYLRWREAQLRNHDRDYQDWRREQHRQYDDEYRRFRAERQHHFGQAFHEWRSQRSIVGGFPDTGVAAGVGGYGDKADVSSSYDRPSGMLDPPGHLSADPAMSQRGGPDDGHGAASTGGDHSSEFGKEPGPVKGASDGKT